MGSALAGARGDVGAIHELLGKAAYDAALAAQSYGMAELTPEYFKL